MKGFLAAVLVAVAALALFLWGVLGGYVLGVATSPHGGLSTPATATTQP